MNIIITGGAGFVGSQLALYLKKHHPEYRITCVDNLSRRGSELQLPLLRDQGIEFAYADVSDFPALEQVIHEPDLIIDAAADPSVLAGMTSPLSVLIKNNFQTTLNCLQLADRYHAKFLFLSSSRVYSVAALNDIPLKVGKTRFTLDKNEGISGLSEQGINEAFSTAQARTFYGATKLASEHFIEEYGSFRNVSYLINRCGVIAGPGQLGKIDQGFLMYWLAQHMLGGRLAYLGYQGSGKQVRDVLHILDLCRVVDHQIQHFDHFAGQTWNLGGGVDRSVSLLELTQKCQQLTKKKITVNKSGEERPGDIPWYITDSSKLLDQLPFSLQKSVDDLLLDTYQWLYDNPQVLERLFS